MKLFRITKVDTNSSEKEEVLYCLAIAKQLEWVYNYFEALLIWKC